MRGAFLPECDDKKEEGKKCEEFIRENQEIIVLWKIDLDEIIYDGILTRKKKRERREID